MFRFFCFSSLQPSAVCTNLRIKCSCPFICFSRLIWARQYSQTRSAVPLSPAENNLGTTSIISSHLAVCQNRFLKSISVSSLLSFVSPPCCRKCSILKAIQYYCCPNITELKTKYHNYIFLRHTVENRVSNLSYSAKTTYYYLEMLT